MSNSTGCEPGCRAASILRAARELSAKQAEDDGLWFDATTVTEAYLQSALRELAAAIEDEEETWHLMR